MTRCICGYCTEDKDNFALHLVDGWHDLRKNHLIK